MKRNQCIGILLVLGILQEGCREGDLPPFFWIPESETAPTLRMDYGIPQGERFPGFSLHPEVTLSHSQLCIKSRSDLVVDYGPRLSICLPLSELKPSHRRQIVSDWQNSLDALIRMSSVRSFPNFQTHTSSTTVRFDFITESALRNQFRKSPPRAYFLGDLRFKRFLGVEMDLSLGGKGEKVSRYYGVPYWNYWEGEECYFFFSTWDISLPANQRRVLRIQMDCKTTQPIFENFFQKVTHINAKEKSTCEDKHLELTEIFSQSESDFGRFLEFRNPSSVANCRNEFLISPAHLRQSHPNSLSGDGIGVKFQGDWEFLFPGAVILLSSSDSKLESYLWEEGYSWNLLTQGNPGIDDYNLEDWNRFSSFRFEDEYPSWRKNPNPCSLKENQYITNERFCGSPGTEESWTLDPGLFCSHEDIYLTEANFWGIQNAAGILDSRDRFLEFYYSGGNDSTPCDPSSLWLDWESQRIPLFVPLSSKAQGSESSEKAHFLQPGEVFLVSLSPNLPREVRHYSRNLFTLNPSRRIQIGSPFSSFGKSWKLIYKPHRDFLKSDLIIIPRDEYGNLYSLVFPDTLGYIDRTIILHHPQEEYLPGNHRRNYMSPGSLPLSVSKSLMDTGNVSQRGNFQITEVLWMGSYSNQQSVLSDRFVEWMNPQRIQGSMYLDIEYPGFPSRRQSYFIPLSGDSFGFISSGNLHCFSGMRGIRSSSFQLFNNHSIFRIYNIYGESEDSFSLDISLHGVNDTSNRIRRSAAINPITRIWFSSIDEDTDCPDETYASPGSLNRIP